VDPEVEGIAPIRTIGFYTNNSIEWILADIGAMFTGTVSVTLYDTLGDMSTPAIIDEAELETVVCGAAHVGNLATLKLKGMISTLKNLIFVEGPTPCKTLAKDLEKAAEAGLQTTGFKEALALGKDYLKAEPNMLKERSAAVKGDSIYTICYTSGSTNYFKGVLLSHTNFLTNARQFELFDSEFLPTGDDVHLSYLPLAHVFERLMYVLSIGYQMKIGIYSGDITQLQRDLQELKPTVFSVVPRLLNRFISAIQQKTKQEKTEEDED
jgi:long-chain acyl-CoA synthetase